MIAPGETLIFVVDLVRPLKRLFAAIPLPPEVETHLDEAVDAARTAHPSCAGSSRRAGT